MNDRNRLADRLESAGQEINDVRVKLGEQNYGFCCGLVRAAEEALVVAVTALRDHGVREEEL